MAAYIEFPPDLIAAPSCPRCGTRMLLVRILPARPGYDQRSYECPRCEHEITEIIKFRKAS